MADLLKHILLDQPLSEQAQALLEELRPGHATVVSKAFVVDDDPWKEPNPRFVLEYIRPSGERVKATQEYSDKFDDQFYKWRFRMDKPEEEMLRVGTRLLSNLRYANVAFGKDYTDNVLWEVVSDRFGAVKQIRATLDEVAYNAPEMSPQYAEARNYVESCVAGLGNSIVLELGYAEPTASAMLAGGVWYALQQRHSLALRRLLSLRR